MAQAIRFRDIESLLAQAIRSRDIESLWSQAVESNESNKLTSNESNKLTSNESSKQRKQQARCLNQLGLVGQLTARELSIVWGSDTRYWKWTKETIGGKCIDVAELINVCWLQIDGKYAASKLTQGLHYEVFFVVKLKDNLNITHPVALTLTLPDGSKQEKKEKLMEEPRNKIIGLTVGEFQAQGTCGCGDVKFSMMATDPHWKHGLVIIGALIIPKI